MTHEESAYILHWNMEQKPKIPTNSQEYTWPKQSRAKGGNLEPTSYLTWLSDRMPSVHEVQGFLQYLEKTKYTTELS